MEVEWMWKWNGCGSGMDVGVEWMWEWNGCGSGMDVEVEFEGVEMSLRGGVVLGLL